jgi:RHH-type proline utilization regulon transcriptional repressor/proline dehydrogenase/delta 1-pyrroline-5-carboxylate dehydrogenase
MRDFANEPVLELRRAPVRAGLADAIASLDAELPLRVGVWIGDDRRMREDFDSTDPGRPARVVAHAAAATPDEVGEALAAAQRGAREWSAVPAERRAAVLLDAARWMRERRLRLAALAVRECAKPWPEADADVCEAIDFLEYYARGAVELERGAPLLQVPGERNEMRWAPRGVAAVISPWNFPLAICCGMTSAALATGNAVVVKPAEQSPACGLMVVEALRAAGVPPDALALLPGAGDVGAALVRDPRVHTIAFTGSQQVGLEIVRTAAEVPDGQRHLKRVIAEMGGKNCVIVDADADLDEVVPALITSAFGFAGQKCSAASRVLCHEAVHDALLERLGGRVEVLRVGDAAELEVDVPAVIEHEAQERVERYIAEARRGGRIAAQAHHVPGGGWFATPTLAAELPEDSPVLSEEIFGPVLALERVRDVAEACDRVDASPYGLTGGLFARNPDTVDYVAGRSPVGNLYVNRNITGAMVGRQPFGGNRLSGTGTKAGGPGYLLQFVEPRVVTENTMRHGLVV